MWPTSIFPQRSLVKSINFRFRISKEQEMASYLRVASRRYATGRSRADGLCLLSLLFFDLIQFIVIRFSIDCIARQGRETRLIESRGTSTRCRIRLRYQSRDKSSVPILSSCSITRKTRLVISFSLCNTLGCAYNK